MIMPFSETFFHFNPPVPYHWLISNCLCIPLEYGDDAMTKPTTTPETHTSYTPKITPSNLINDEYRKPG
jgi:hypothetical protein